MTYKTGIIMDPLFLEHHPDDGHPESPARLQAIYRLLREDPASNPLILIPPRAAEKGEILRVHSADHLKRIAATAGVNFSALTPDTHASAFSYQAATLAAGGLFQAVTEVMAGKVNNAFVLARPPGHHAEKSRAMGYCLFNNVALAARFALDHFNIQKVLIVDWDVHHGNGTQHIFEQNPEVLFFSVHQRALFPGTGVFTETGVGRGEGFTINVPLPKNYGDGEYAAIFERLLRPVALDFMPDLILVSAGFDAHRLDSMSGMLMTAAGFAGLTRSVMQIADVCCNGKLVLTLEGGYHVPALSESVKAVWAELSGQTCCDVAALAQQASPDKLKYALHRSVNVHQTFWRSLRASEYCL